MMRFSLRSHDGKVIDMDGHDLAFALVVETRIKKAYAFPPAEYPAVVEEEEEEEEEHA